jgi:hypothetical protein
MHAHIPEGVSESHRCIRCGEGHQAEHGPMG